MARKPSLIRRIATGIWRTIATIYALLLIVVLLVLPVGMYFVFFGNSSVTVPAQSALVWVPAGDLVEQQDRSVGDLLGSLMSRPEPQTLVRDLIESLERAADDDRIELAFLKLDELGAAQPGQLEDLVAAIDRFKQSGKSVVAWSPAYDQAQYQLASHADTIFLDSYGYVFLPGYGVFRNYFKDAIDRLDVEINVFRVGEYKSYVEPFTRNDMSPQARAANQVWLNSLWQTYRETVTASRDLAAADIDAYTRDFPQTLARAGGDAAEVALTAGLVDEVASLPAIRDAMRQRVGTDDNHGSFRQISHRDYLRATASEFSSPGDESLIAQVTIEGPIVDGESVSGSAGGETVARLIAQARRDDRAAALLVRVNSPGGSVTGSERIREQVALTRQAGKPVVVSMAGVAASGGYWVSMNADEIWAEPSTLTGSIGIFGLVPTFAEPLNELGIHSDGVGTTPLSGALRLDTSLSEPVKMMLQAGVEHGYEQFIAQVADARQMSVDAVEQIAQGRVWSGADAERIGLVDRLGGYRDAEQAAARLAGLGPDDYVLEPIRPPADWQAALRQFLNSQARSMFVPDWAAELVAPSALQWFMNGLNDPRHLYAHCFCALDAPDAGFQVTRGARSLTE